MYYCEDCGCIFEEPKKYAEDRTPGGAFEGGSFIEYFEGCPLCAGNFIEYEEEEEENGEVSSDELLQQ